MWSGKRLGRNKQVDRQTESDIHTRQHALFCNNLTMQMLHASLGQHKQQQQQAQPQQQQSQQQDPGKAFLFPMILCTLIGCHDN